RRNHGSECPDLRKPGNDVRAEGALLEAVLDDRLEVFADVLARGIPDQLVLLGKQLVHQIVVVALELIGSATLLRCCGGAHGTRALVVVPGAKLGKAATALPLYVIYFCRSDTIARSRQFSTPGSSLCRVGHGLAVAGIGGPGLDERK